MTPSVAPQVDPRSAADVAQQLRQLLQVYSPAWHEVDSTNAPEGVSAALIGVSARFAEVLIQRLNQVPQKNFLAFLELLGAARLPPQPARVPVTFLLAKGSLVDAVVPPATQVAAPPGPGEKDPVIYETEHELIATAAQLASAMARDPEQDTYADYSNDIATGSPGIPVFHGNQQIAHILYLGHDHFLDSPGITNLTLSFELESDSLNLKKSKDSDKKPNDEEDKKQDGQDKNPDDQDKKPDDELVVEWGIWDGEKWHGIKPIDITGDGTKNLSTSGTIVFGEIPPAQATQIGGITKEWIRGRLLTPITRSSDPRSGMVRATRLPRILRAGMRLRLHGDKLPLGDAYSSSAGAIDLSKDFHPFGEKPKFNDTFWMAAPQVFSNAGATVTLNVEVTSPPNSNVQTPPPALPSRDLRLLWEAWNGRSWVKLGTSGSTGEVATVVDGKVVAIPFKDTTKALSQNGTVVFTLPPNVGTFNVNGKDNFWIRVRIGAGNYGVEGQYVPNPALTALLGTSGTGTPMLGTAGTGTSVLGTAGTGAPAQGTAGTGEPAPGGTQRAAGVATETPFIFNLPTFRPPSISSLTAMYDLDKPAPGEQPALPEAVLAENDFVITDFTVSNGQRQVFAPFQPSSDARPTLYFGFALPPGRTAFPNSTITAFFVGAGLRYQERTIPLDPDVSRNAADPGNPVSHRFVIANPGASEVVYGLHIFGHQWAAATTILNSNGSKRSTSPSKIGLSAGDWVEVDIQVTVPAGTPFGASDGGIIQLIAPDQRLYSAEFVTFAHAEEEETQQPQLAWEYWDGQGWAKLIVHDETDHLTTTGIIEFLAPPDFAAHGEFGASAWWLRVRWDTGDYDTAPRIARVLLNTCMAAQLVTIRNEVLGSSNGNANQSFQTTRAPVLAGQSLAVREPEKPSGEELEAILDAEGPDAVLVSPDSAGKPSEIWVTWHEVTDFYASDPRSRHYVLDHISGEVRFGDGLSGMTPPVGSANIRLTTYKTGGGARGNRPAGSIVQLKTTVPYIDKVTNIIDATGGADAESADSLTSRAPLELRHRHRAVTPEDYEDLVHLASSEVARVLCVPNRNLVADPFDLIPAVLGNVSLVVVPETTDAKPQPSLELVRRVQNFISDACPVTATVHVVGPLYLQVKITAEVGIASLDAAGTLALKVQNALAAFLHPLTGGFDGQGWEFGREPHRSDFFRVIEEIPNVDHTRALTVETIEDSPGSRKTGRFLVYSGVHNVTLVFKQ